VDKIRLIRVKKKMTQKTLAIKAGVERSMISRAERGERKPSLETAARIAKALGCKVDDLIDD